ncbi:conserved hypothetical protein [Alteracholeplasma palmae J233]|uniref:Uncharacterized protein n=1 Tax=Alteracholeplasma palmae (strain ATCC 49389 / J233) TaxID=1318466 RepID=U4KLT0_ALTPJ|nr:hypothetical protein [Alteracholeplasma palmae]CCV64939.1 conserved hypothetical protein [Alteracholeplasma palmae J233]
MKLLPKIYKGITGEPFRVENYKGNKIEFHYLDETPFLARYASKGKFAVWTSNGIDYKLLIEKGYYETVEDLYSNEVNEIWLDFMTFAYGIQAKVTKKYNLFLLIAVLVALGATILLSQVINNDMIAFSIGMAILFVPMLLATRKQQKEIGTAIREENVNSTQKIKDVLGEKRFEDLLTAQQAYYDKYFAFEEEETTNEDEEVKEIEVVDAELVEDEEAGDKTDEQ